MESSEFKMKRAAVAVSLASTLAFFACTAPKAESLYRTGGESMTAHAKGARLSPSKAATKEQRRFIESFLKDFEAKKFDKPMSLTNLGSDSTVTVEYFRTGKDASLHDDDVIDGSKKEVELRIRPNSDVAKVIIIFNEPVQFSDAWGIASELYHRQFVMHNGEDPVFRPERDSRQRMTGNVEAIGFWIIRKAKK